MLGPLVAQGNYDLVVIPDGTVILPQVWEDLAQPDWFVTMQMWPISKRPVRPLPGISNILQNIVQEAKKPKLCEEVNLPNSMLPSNDKRTVKFKDCVGRNFIFPYYKVKSWIVSNTLSIS